MVQNLFYQAQVSLEHQLGHKKYFPETIIENMSEAYIITKFYCKVLITVNRLAQFADDTFNAKLSLVKIREIDEWGVYNDYL